MAGKNTPIIILDDSDDEPQITRSTPAPQPSQSKQVLRSSLTRPTRALGSREPARTTTSPKPSGYGDNTTLYPAPQHALQGPNPGPIESRGQSHAHGGPIQLTAPMSIANTPFTTRFFNDMAYQIVTLFPYQDFAKVHGCSVEGVRRMLMEKAVQPILTGSRSERQQPQAQTAATGHSNVNVQVQGNLNPVTAPPQMKTPFHIAPVDPHLVDPQLMNPVSACSGTLEGQNPTLVDRQVPQPNNERTLEVTSRKRQVEEVEISEVPTRALPPTAQQETSPKKPKLSSAPETANPTPTASPAPISIHDAWPDASTGNIALSCTIPNPPRASDTPSVPAATPDRQPIQIDSAPPGGLLRYPETSQRHRVVVDNFGAYVDASPRSSEGQESEPDSPVCTIICLDSPGPQKQVTNTKNALAKRKSLYEIATQKDREVMERHFRGAVSGIWQKQGKEDDSVVDEGNGEAGVPEEFDLLECLEIR